MLNVSRVLLKTLGHGITDHVDHSSENSATLERADNAADSVIARVVEVKFEVLEGDGGGDDS